MKRFSWQDFEDMAMSEQAIRNILAVIGEYRYDLNDKIDGWLGDPDFRRDHLAIFIQQYYHNAIVEALDLLPEGLAKDLLHQQALGHSHTVFEAVADSFIAEWDRYKREERAYASTFNVSLGES